MSPILTRMIGAGSAGSGFGFGRRRGGPSGPPTYSVSPSTASVNEGSSVTFTVTTANVSDGTTLYWSLNTVSGTINTSDFTGAAVTGSFTITSGSGSVVLALANDNATEGSESFQLQVRTGSTSGTIVATSSTVTIGDTSRLVTFRLTLDGSPSSGGGGRTVMDVQTSNTNIPQLFVHVANGNSGYNNGGSGTGNGSPGGGSSALYWSTSPNWLAVVGGGGGGGNCGGTEGGGGVGAGGASYECTDPGNSAPTGSGGGVGEASGGASGSTSAPGGGGGGGAGASGGGGGQPFGGDNPGNTRDLATGGGGGAGNMRATSGPAAPYAPAVSISLVTGSPGGAGPSAQRCIIVYNSVTYYFSAGTNAPLGNLPTPIPW